VIFNSVLYNSHHVLYQLLHHKKDIGYNLRKRSYSLPLFLEDNNLIRKNFLHEIFTMLYVCYSILLQDCKIVSYVLLILHSMSYYRGNSMYACWCHGLRLSDLNKENQRSVTHDYLRYINILTFLLTTWTLYVATGHTSAFISRIFV